MPLKVGELFATLKVDAKDFNQGIDQAGSKLKGLGNIVGAGVRATAAMFTATTLGLTALGVAAFNVGVDYNKLQQNSRAALTTLLGSAEAANEQMAKLDEFAKNSPFAKQVFITAQQQLLGFGVEAEKVIPILDAVQNAVASVGGSNAEVSSITYALAQMQGQGKLTGETLNQLGQYGIDAASILGEKFGKTGAEIRDMASKPGGIPVSEVWDPLTTGLMEKFGGATDNIKKQMDGATDRVKGAWRDIGSIIAAPFVDPNGGGRAVDWVNALADVMRAAEQKAKPLVDLLVHRFSPGLDSVVPLLEKAESAINSWDLSKVNGQLDDLAKYTPFISAAAAGLLAMGGSSLGLGALGIKLNPVVAAFAALVATSPDLRSELGSALQAFEPLVPIVGELAGGISDELVEILQILAPAIGDVVEIGGDLATAFLNGFAPALTAVVNAGAPVASLLADIVGVISGLPTPVLATVAAFAALNMLGVPKMLSGIVSVSWNTFIASMTLASMHAAALGRNATFLGTAALVAKGGVQALGTALKTAFISNPITLAVAAVSTAIGLFIGHQEKARQKAEEHAQALEQLRGSLDQTTAGITAATRELVYNEFANDPKLIKALEDTGMTLRDMVDMAVDPASQKLAELSAEVGASNEKWIANASALDKSKDAFLINTRGIEDNVQSNGNLALILNSVRDRASEVSGEQEKLRQKIEATSTAVRDNTEANMENAGIVLSAKEANLRYNETMLSLTQQVKENNATLADGTLTAEAHEKAVLDNESALYSLARQSLSVIDANRRNNESTEELQARMELARNDFIALAQETGKTADQAAALADELGLIPGRYQADVTLKDNVTLPLDQITQKLLGLNRLRVTPTVAINGAQVVDFAALGKKRADGGLDDYGRTVQRVPQIVAGGRNVIWGEPETGWEAYISGKPSARSRNLQVLDEAARRLGVMVVESRPHKFADGGLPGPVPSGSSDAGLFASLIDRFEALLSAVADRPVRLNVDGRVFAETVAESERRFQNR